MRFVELPLAGAYELELDPKRDSRGYFVRTYDSELFLERGLQTLWIQENQSLSVTRGVVRGLHFQRGEHAETKLVRVLQGSILDVIVDLRKGSETFGEHAAVELSAENQKALYIPRGFAHGFCTLDAPAIICYKVDAYYSPESEGGLFWNDPELGIEWPISDPIMSEKDARLPGLLELVPPL